MGTGSVTIETRSLCRTFGSHRGIVDVDLEVRRGEVFGFLGPNGAGKSTTIRILMGLYRATSGEARVLDLDVAHDAVQIHRRTGYLPGDLTLYPRLTGRELLDRFGRARGIDDRRYRDQLVERFNADLDRPTQTLSKGNRQKLGLVLAFMHQPELVVLDEPTSGLDPLLQREFQRLLTETTDAGRTVFLSSHDLDEVQRVVHRLAIIKEGRIVVTDTVEGLRANAPRTIDVTFAHDIGDAAFSDLPGITTLPGGSSRHAHLTLIGPVGPLLKRLAALDPVDLRAQPADLDELFRGYYRAGTVHENEHAH